MRATAEGVAFAPLYERDGESLVPAGTVDRGDSALAEPGEGYGDALAALDRRAADLEALAETDRTRPADVGDAYAEGRR